MNTNTNNNNNNNSNNNNNNNTPISPKQKNTMEEFIAKKLAKTDKNTSKTL
jgi:hypothetical protein